MSTPQTAAANPNNVIRQGQTPMSNYAIILQNLPFLVNTLVDNKFIMRIPEEINSLHVCGWHATNVKDGVKSVSNVTTGSPIWYDQLKKIVFYQIGSRKIKLPIVDFNHACITSKKICLGTKRLIVGPTFMPLCEPETDIIDSLQDLFQKPLNCNVIVTSDKYKDFLQIIWYYHTLEEKNDTIYLMYKDREMIDIRQLYNDWTNIGDIEFWFDRCLCFMSVYLPFQHFIGCKTWTSWLTLKENNRHKLNKELQQPLEQVFLKCFNLATNPIPKRNIQSKNWSSYYGPTLEQHYLHRKPTSFGDACRLYFCMLPSNISGITDNVHQIREYITSIETKEIEI